MQLYSQGGNIVNMHWKCAPKFHWAAYVSKISIAYMIPHNLFLDIYLRASAYSSKMGNYAVFFITKNVPRHISNF